MQYNKNNFTKVYLFEIIWVAVIGSFGRLIPHMPNITPILGLCLFAGANLPQRISFLLVAATMIFSDICLALIFGYPTFSYFTLFTYTGFAAVILLSAKGARPPKAGAPLSLRRRLNLLLLSLYVLGTSCGFWMWTNFGVWLTSGLYAKTLDGLVTCYYMAIPFLRNSLIGDLIWSYLIFGVFYILLEKKIVTREGLLLTPQLSSPNAFVGDPVSCSMDYSQHPVVRPRLQRSGLPMAVVTNLPGANLNCAKRKPKGREAGIAQRKFGSPAKFVPPKTRGNDN